MRSADPISALNSAVSEVVSRFFPTTVVHSRSGDKHWFDSNCHRAYDAKQTAYRAWSRSMEQIGEISLCTLILRHSWSMGLQWHLIISVPGGH